MGRDNRSGYCKENIVLNRCLLKVVTFECKTARANRWQYRKVQHPCTGLSRCLFFMVYISNWRRDSEVGIATGYALDGRMVEVRVPVAARFFSSTRHPPSLLSNGYRALFPRGLGGQGVNMITHLQLLARSRIRGSIYPLPIRRHGVVHN
jgi:hypothetical protein